MEWVVIVVAPSLPTEKFGQDPASVAAAYAEHPTRTALLAGWLSLVLLGRVLFVAGLREALRNVPRVRVWLDFALSAMLVSVTIEIVDYALVAAGAGLAHAGGSADAIVALDAAGTLLFLVLFAPIGVSVLAASLGMLASGFFRKWICYLGVVSGGVLTLGGVLAAAAHESTGSFHDVGGALASLPVPFVWIWLVATGVTVWRAPRSAELREFA
jgi:hypothetical protein